MTHDFAAGNYRFIPAVFQYSSGAAAASGYEIERVRFDRLVPLAEGFAQVAAYIQAAGRPLTAFCACELRSPAAFTEDGFLKFNQHYVKTLAQWGIFDGTTNPVARSNVCPEIDPPAEPSFYAFSFTRPAQGIGNGAAPSFVIAGGAEARGGAGSYPERIVRYRDLSPEGLQEKVRFTTREMERRMELFGFGWNDTTAAQAYSIRDFHPVVADELVRRGALRSGLTWHFARPPVIDLEYEMDCRRVLREVVI
ncbi:2-amino-5-chloromuconate deaminase CnbZ [Bradyrhizobium sp.]|uniref:2-amino-5-chloromuconate deaminase CnbZ n=1 Tax=Bradyrhizobium sp. TaxID=376 RepID=UPI003C66E897